MATELGSRLDRGITLPFDWFCDAGVFRLEQRRVFADSWLYAGVLDWVGEPGQFFTTRAGLVPIVVVRDEDGNLNAFVNICRHRATEVAEGRGRRMSLQCPYHAWTYGLDGCLRSAPRSELEPGFDRADFGLVPVAVDTWGPFVFVNVDAQPLARYLGRLPQIVADAGVDFGRMRFRDHAESEIAANWKAVVENYLECYHCAGSHPEFCVTADPRVRTTEEFNRQAFDPGPFWSMDAPLRRGTMSASATGEPVSAVPLGRDEPAWGRARAFGSWCAGSVVYCYADYAMVHQIDPVSPRETRVHLTWFVHEDAPERDLDIPSLTHVWHRTTEQDVALIERAQAGLQSRRYAPGPLSTAHEPYIHSSLTLYLARMAGDDRTAELLAGA
jgi:choline monooxygenase